MYIIIYKRIIYVLAIFLFSYVYGGQFTRTFKFDSNNLRFSKNNGYDVINVEDCGFIRNPGFPMLPEKRIEFLIPCGASITDIRVTSCRTEVIPGEYNVYPVQKPYPISGKRKSNWEQADEIYSKDLDFPKKNIKHSNTGNMGGYKIASFIVSPIQYNPIRKGLILNSEITVQVSYKENGVQKFQHKGKYNPVFRNSIRNRIINPEILQSYPDFSNSKFGIIEYVIITTDSFVSSFQPLADWKSRKGVPAKIVILDSIYANYSGRNNAEKIRNFIKYANTNWGSLWFLLGGQCDYENGHQIVPRRDVYYISSEEGAYVDEDTIPSDLYFSDLDGSWDNDSDGVWGESPVDGDTVDLYGDVFIGRVPARRKLQVQNFVNKVLTYEKNPPFGYLRRMFLPTAELFYPTHDGTISQEVISSITPSDWNDIKLYERDGDLTRARTIDTIKSGVGFVHLVGHGNANGIYLYGDGPYLTSVNADTLKNGAKLCIINSIACFTGALDEVVGGDCFAEHLLNATQGGAVGVIMNSRYGWGNANGVIGESEAVDTAFYNEIFINNNYNLGAAHTASKNVLVPGIFWTNDVLPWVLYELNLFGDPEMPLWTDEPKDFEVTKSDTILVGQDNFPVTVTSISIPVEGALVCAMKEGEVYARDYTDGSGQLNLTLLPSPSTIGDMYLTVTKPNYLPYEDTILVKSVGLEDNLQTANKEPRLIILQNPFCNNIVIHYSLPMFYDLRIKIYNISGSCVKTIIDGQKPAGVYDVKLSTKDFVSGIYFVRMDIGDYQRTKKLVFIK